MSSCTALAASLLSLLLLSRVAVYGEDWPQWRGPNRDGVWNETGIIKSFPPGGLTVRWRSPVGLGFSSPVVAEGRVYVTDAVLRRPNVRERVHCVDAHTGKLLWIWSYDAAHPEWIFMPGQERGPGGTPIVQDGRVYALGGFGDVCCLDSANGRVIWQRTMSKTYQLREFPTDASPLIEGDLLIVLIGGKHGASVVALDRKSGNEVWKSLDEPSTHSSPLVIMAGGKRQLIVWTQHSIISLNPTNGATYWREPLQTSADFAVSTPVVQGDLLLIGGLMLNLGVDTPTASVLWPGTRALSRRILSNTSTAVLQGEYVFSAKTSGELVCLEAGTGNVLWETNQVTGLKSGASIHLTPCGEAAFLFTDQGDLILAQLTPKGYREISRARLLEPTWPFGNRKCAWAMPAYANRHVFARNDTELVCASLEVKP